MHLRTLLARSSRQWLRILGRGVLVPAIAVVLSANTALADVAPPNMPPGSNISPDVQTFVQMQAERILITVKTHEAAQSAFLVGDVAEAQVTGEFMMRNLGKTAERMQVRFPMADPSGTGSGFFTYPEVQNFVVSVDGQSAPVTDLSLPNPQSDADPPIHWAAFDVTFPVTRQVVISVSYGLSPTGYLPEALFAYVLSTGAGWRGPIGKADITLRLPYPSTAENVVVDKSRPGARIVNGEVRWHWTNLEPTPKDDWYATLLVPDIWREIVNARKAVQQALRDAQKWLALSQAYIKAVPFKYEPQGGKRFIQLGIQAMQRAVTLAPKSADMHAEYAGLLWYLYRFDVAQAPGGSVGRRIFKELDIALKLDPANGKAQAIKADIDEEINANKPKG